MTRYIMFFDDKDKVYYLHCMIEMIVHPNKDVRIIAAEGLVTMIRGMSPETKEDLYARYLPVLTPKLVRLDCVSEL